MIVTFYNRVHVKRGNHTFLSKSEKKYVYHDISRIAEYIMKRVSNVNPAAKIRNSYTMGCPPVRGDNPRALASGLSYIQVDKHGITILYHLHQCRPCTS